jgi:cell division septation protein DedD
MQRGYGGTAFEPVQPERRDRELTLGPFVLTLLGCGLFTLCGLCFVFGYTVGHRYAETSTTISVPPPAPRGLSQPASPQSKPAAGQSGAQPQAPAETTDSSDASDTDSTGAGTPAAVAAAPAGNPSGAGVHTVAAATQPAAVTQPATGGIVQPALSSQATGIMVQIAAVSHPEDADVLVGALRKRGYAVSARRDPTDGLLHVQIGPFANRSDAYAMRQKLLNDGYNAIVQP